MNDRVLGIELDRVAKALLRLLVLASVEKQISEIDQGLRIIGA